MKTITAKELNNCLASHKLWVETRGKQGIHADLTGADLHRADLRGAILTDANLTRANLGGANLEDADLTHANLAGAYLRGANLAGANLAGAYLRGADLTGTILEKNKAEKQPEVGSVKSENLRFEIEAIAKKYGMKVDSIALSFL